MEKTYYLDFETLLKTLSNGTFEITTSLTVSSMPATGFISLYNGKIVTYYVQLHDGRRIDGSQVYRLLMKQGRWQVQQGQPSIYRMQPVQPLQPHRHTVPLQPMATENATPARKPVVSGSGQGPTQKPQGTMPARKPIVSGSGQGPAQTPQGSSPNQQPLSPFAEQATPATPVSRPAYVPRPAYTPPVLSYPYSAQEPANSVYREPTQPLSAGPAPTSSRHPSTAPLGGPKTDALPPANTPRHYWRQKNTLNLDLVAHLPARERLVLRTVLAMINGQRDTQAIQEYLTLQAEVVNEALQTLTKLGIIE